MHATVSPKSFRKASGNLHEAELLLRVLDEHQHLLSDRPRKGSVVFEPLDLAADDDHESMGTRQTHGRMPPA